MPPRTPASLSEAIEACVRFAQTKHHRSVDQLADLVGTSKWTIYKWIESGQIPARLIRPFEHACGVALITKYLAASAGLLTVQMPTGRAPNPADINAVQAACTAAVAALIDFAGNKRHAADTLFALTNAMEHLAHQRGQVERHTQPELELHNGH